MSLRLAFLDVGHGDFAYVQTPADESLVIDLGSGDDVIPTKFLSKVTTIHELQVSHPHTDHFDDVVDFTRGRTIKSFRCRDLSRFADRDIGWRHADKAKIAALRTLKKQVGANNDAVKATVDFSHSVWATESFDPGDPNTASFVTIITYKGVKVLFGGDLPCAGWESLLKNPNFVTAIKGTTIFKTPHHGRDNGCCEALFDVPGFAPSLCVISDKPVEQDNEATTATAWYTQRTKGCNVTGSTEPRKVLTTRSDGSIFIKVDDEGTWYVHPNTTWKTD